MARKTPDYTKQARQRKRRPAPARVSRASSRRRWITYAGFGTLLFSTAMAVYGLAISLPDVNVPGVDGNKAIIAVIAFLACIATAALIGLLLLYVEDPVGFPFARFTYRGLMYAAMFVGAIAALLVLSAHVSIAILFMSLVPTLLVVTLVLRPRMRELDATSEQAAMATAGAGGGAGGGRAGGARPRKAPAGKRRPSTGRPGSGGRGGQSPRGKGPDA